MQAVNRIVCNTSIQYVRLLFTFGLSLFSTRFILIALGDIDYGIYNLLSGIILLLSFVNAAMTVTTQRYLSVSQGSGDLLQQNRIFINSLVLHIILAVIVIILIEISGLFIFNGFLNIPEQRISEAYYVYHFMGLTVFFTVLSVPFVATLTAHENMFWISIVYIIEAILKFLISVLLIYFFKFKLITYGLLITLVSAVTFFLYAFYCQRKYVECSVVSIRYWDKKTIKMLASFASWNLLNVLTSLGENQGLAILLNKFMGAYINAAYGIANQVSSQLNFISQSLLNAVNPQIMKSEGMCDRGKMLRLSMLTSKYGFFLLAIFALPCIFEMPSILRTWLGDVPNYTVLFCRWMLVVALLNQLTIGLASANQAIGKIKIYMLTIGSIRLLILPLGFFLLKLGYPIYGLFGCYAFLVGLASIVRVYLMKKLVNLDVYEFCIKVFLKILIPFIFSVLSCYYITKIDLGNCRFIYTIIFSGLIFIISIYWFGMGKEERCLLKQICSKISKSMIGWYEKRK